jgi:hypothetical protein
MTVALRGGMSALLPKADVCGAARDVCFGPKADTPRWPAGVAGGCSVTFVLILKTMEETSG